MAIRHTVPAGLPTGTVSGKVAGDDWRADHLHVPFEYMMFHAGMSATAANRVYTLLPLTAGTLEPHAPATRFIADLDQATQMRLMIGQATNGAGGTSCHARLQYATNGATQTTWADAQNTGTGIDLRAGTANTVKESGWVDLVTGAKAASTYMRFAIVTVGTVTTAPTISWAAVMFR